MQRLSFALLVMSIGCAAQVSEPERGESIARLSTASCARELRCSPARFAHTWASLDDCEARQGAWYRGVLESPHVVDADGFASRCAAALENDGCDFGQPNACLPDPGTQVDEGTCHSGFDCASRTCVYAGSWRAGVPTCGKCAPTIAKPSSCTSCRLGELCIAGVCRRPAKAGEVCSDVGCEGNAPCIDGLCVAFAHTGAACSAAAPCDPEVDRCDPALHVCTPLRFARLGEACGRLPGGYVGCPQWLTCKTYDSGVGTCVAKPREGDPCGEDNACLLPFRCVAGACTAANVCAE